MPQDSPYLQKDAFIGCQDSLWIPAFHFYLFTLLWLISYLKLQCTNIQSQNVPPNYDLESVPQQNEFFCKDCYVVRRPDIYHCNECNVCCEMHDHHCGVLQVCICAVNYKYFVLFIFYSALSLITATISISILPACFNNSVIEEIYSTVWRYILAVVLGIFGLVVFSLSCVFVSESPGCSETPDSKIIK